MGIFSFYVIILSVDERICFNEFNPVLLRFIDMLINEDESYEYLAVV